MDGPWGMETASCPCAHSRTRLPPPPLPTAVAARAPDGSACPGTELPRSTADDVRRTVFAAAAAPGAATVGGLYAACSAGATRINPGNSLVANLVELPCSGTSPGGLNYSTALCTFADMDGWSDAADGVLAARGVDLARYPHRVYLHAPGMCPGWAGFASLGCAPGLPCRAWIGGGFWTTPQVRRLNGGLGLQQLLQPGGVPARACAQGIPLLHSCSRCPAAAAALPHLRGPPAPADRPQVLAHELGHHLNLNHGRGMQPNGAIDEYGDVSALVFTLLAGWMVG